MDAPHKSIDVLTEEAIQDIMLSKGLDKEKAERKLFFDMVNTLGPKPESGGLGTLYQRKVSECLQIVADEIMQKRSYINLLGTSPGNEAEIKKLESDITQFEEKAKGAGIEITARFVQHTYARRETRAMVTGYLNLYFSFLKKILQ